MLRSLCLPAARSLSQQHRSFVSTVLLTRSWDKLTVNDLKKEAKSRGLSPTGNKSTLIWRIQEHEKSLSSVANTAAPVSVSTPPEIPSVEAREGETPGIPLAAQTAAPSPYYLNVSLPDAAYEEPEPLVQIPFTFDSTNSNSTTTEESSLESVMPKIVVIGSEETYGPTHNLFDEAQLSSQLDSTSAVEGGKGGIIDDIAEDMGLPHLKDVKKSILKFFS